MRRVHARLVLSLAACVSVALVGAASTAHAAQPVPFTITEEIDFANGVFDFTATGPLCPSGTFEDTVVAVGIAHHDPSGLNLLIRTVYTCDDGSGTFDAIKHVFITFADNTNTGPIELQGGTGAYTNLSGQGIDSGFTVGDLGTGNITGVLVRT